MKFFKRKSVAVALMLVLSSSAVAADYISGFHEPTETVADNYSGTAVQALGKQPDGRSDGSFFTDNSHQTILGEGGTVYSSHDSFAGNAFQQVITGVAEHSSFSGTTKQYVGTTINDGIIGGTTGTSRFGKFTEQSAQVLGLKGDFVGNPDGNNKARSEKEFFTDNARQTIYGVGTATGDSFTNNTTQELYDSASTLGGKFGDNARQ